MSQPTSKDKGKAVITAKQKSQKANEPSSHISLTSYKMMLDKSPVQAQKDALKAMPADMRLRDDAYSKAIKSTMPNEYVYPFIPISMIYIAPIESKYAHLSAQEISTFYLRNSADPFFYPKDYSFYAEILTATNSVDFDSVTRSGSEWAYSKAFIRRVLTPEQWPGDMFSQQELPKTSYSRRTYNYFDYIKAWEGAFCYENKQRRHTWFLQFKEIEPTRFPQWFIIWFLNWGLHPMILPDKIRATCENFSTANPSLKFSVLVFTAVYQVPWILKWDVTIVQTPLTKFNSELSMTLSYLGRRILIKWWDKFDFFHNSVFGKQGIISFEKPLPTLPSPTPKPELSSLLKELLSSSSPKELRKQLLAALPPSDDEDDGGSYMADSQDPNEDTDELDLT